MIAVEAISFVIWAIGPGKVLSNLRPPLAVDAVHRTLVSVDLPAIPQGSLNLPVILTGENAEAPWPPCRRKKAGLGLAMPAARAPHQRVLGSAVSLTEAADAQLPRLGARTATDLDVSTLSVPSALRNPRGPQPLPTRICNGAIACALMPPLSPRMPLRKGAFLAPLLLPQPRPCPPAAPA